MSVAAIISRVEESGGGDLSVFAATFLEKSIARRMAATVRQHRANTRPAWMSGQEKSRSWSTP